MRTGLLAKKLGMSRIFAEDGQQISVTLLDVTGNQIVKVKKADSKDAYDAVQVGYGSKKSKNISKAQRESFAKLKIEPKRAVKEFRVANENTELNGGDVISPEHFVVGQKVDVSGISKGKGFSGAMKRHNFGGLEATHGVSISHRSHGSTGHCQEPGRVFKGKKMAGQYGNKRVTKQNLKVVLVDAESGIIAVKGAVPGSKGAIIEIRDAVKSKLPEGLAFPAAIVSAKPSKEAKEDAVEKKDKESIAENSEAKQEDNKTTE